MIKSYLRRSPALQLGEEMFEGLSLLFAALIVYGILFFLFLVLVRWLHVGTLKAFSYLLGAVLGVIAVMSALALWETRVAAIPGSYHVTGVWGYSTLALHMDHTVTQEVQFLEYDQPSVPPYKQHPT